MREKCGIGGINNMEELNYIDYIECKYCGEPFTSGMEVVIHEQACEKRRIEVLDKKDNINPTHYNKGKKDLIEMWYQTMTLEQFRGSMKSNIIKYTMRYENKNGVEDLNKAIEYIERLKKYEENELNRN